MNTLRYLWLSLARAGRLRRALLMCAVLVSLLAVPIAATVHELQQHLHPSDALLNGPAVVHGACEICGAFAGAGHALAAKPLGVPVLPACAPETLGAAGSVRQARVPLYLERAPPHSSVSA